MTPPPGEPSPPTPRRSERLLREDDADLIQPALSPDGLRLAYVRADHDGSALWLADADGDNAERLDLDGGEIDLVDPRWPTWSPDGERLAFSADVDGQSEIFTVAGIDGEDLERLTEDDGDDRHPSWSPDGFYSHRIFYIEGSKEYINTDRLQIGSGGFRSSLVAGVIKHDVQAMLARQPECNCTTNTTGSTRDQCPFCLCYFCHAGIGRKIARSTAAMQIDGALLEVMASLALRTFS